LFKEAAGMETTRKGNAADFSEEMHALTIFCLQAAMTISNVITAPVNPMEPQNLG
jgi:hypothetical protein